MILERIDAPQVRGHDLYRTRHAGRALTLRIAVNRGEDSLAGDLNGDGRVDLADLAVLSANWNRSGTRAHGDLTGDGRVDAADLAVLAAQWNQQAPRLPVVVSLPGSDAYGVPATVTMTSYARQLHEAQRRRSWISIVPEIPPAVSRVNAPADWPSHYWPLGPLGTPGDGYEYAGHLAAGGWWCDAVCAAVDEAIRQFGGDATHQVLAGFSLGAWAANALDRHASGRWALVSHVGGWFVGLPYTPRAVLVAAWTGRLRTALAASGVPLLIGCGATDAQRDGLDLADEFAEVFSRTCRLDVLAGADHVGGYKLWRDPSWNDRLLAATRKAHG